MIDIVDIMHGLLFAFICRRSYCFRLAWESSINTTEFTTGKQTANDANSHSHCSRRSIMTTYKPWEQFRDCAYRKNEPSLTLTFDPLHCREQPWAVRLRVHPFSCGAYQILNCPRPCRS